MRFTKIDEQMGKWTKQDLDAMLAARRRQAARDKLEARVKEAKTKATDLGIEAASKTQSLAASAFNWVKANPTETLVGIMAIAVMDIEDQLDDIS